MTPPAPAIHRFRHPAMAAHFEILVSDEEEAYARQAARAAFEELDAIERDLSRYIESSDVSQLNRLRPGQTVRLGLSAVECLTLAARICRESAGAFDIAMGPLIDLWKRRDGADPAPSPEAIEEARRRSGIDKVTFDPETRMAGVAVQGVCVDLGAIGKGYALDRMAAILGDWGVGRAVLHSGESTALALEAPAGSRGWSADLRCGGDRERSFGTLSLRRCAMSGSGREMHGPHIVDPRTGTPALAMAAAWALAPSAALSDALSTAFMAMTLEEIAAFCARHESIGGAVLPTGEATEPARFGAWP